MRFLVKKLVNKAIAVLAIGLATMFAEARPVQLNPDNTVLFKGAVTEQSVAVVQAEIEKLNQKRGSSNYPIYLVIESPGGSIGAGMDFIEYAKNVPNLHTITIFAASMAAGIVEALPGERLILSTGTLMFHRASGGFQGQFENGEVESRLLYAKDIVKEMERINSERMKLPLSKYKELVNNEYWLFGKNAVDKMAADETVSLICSKELIEKSSYMNVETIFGPVGLKFSACPLFKNMDFVKAEDELKYENHLKIVRKLNGN